MSVRLGVTLIELLVVLAVLAILATVVGLTLQSAHPFPIADGIHAAAALARDSSIRSGHTIIIVFETDSQPYDITALPDGRVVADKRLAIDLLSGKSHATP